MNFKVGELYLYHEAYAPKNTSLLRVLQVVESHNKDDEKVYTVQLFNIPPPDTIALSDSAVTRLTKMGGKFKKLEGKAVKLALAKFMLKL